MSPLMSDETRVLYNETCPVCRFEIDAYARRAARDGLPLRFETLSEAALWGLTPDQAARRLHVMHGGELLSGVPAFRALWSRMPHMAWAARVAGWPVIAPLAAGIYDHILAPALYAMHRKREAQRARKA
jgi:predicted DCC family thiol-disulfide oxidoreductase YuxK